MRKLFLIPITVMLALAGCVQNMSDLKDRLGDADEPLEPAATIDEDDAEDTLANATEPLAPPVARISVYGGNGALVYKASFQADDVTEPVFVEAESTLNLIAGESEALEPGADITTYAWTLDGKPVEGGRQASAQVGDAGLYALQLTVTDSNGQSDTQNVTLAVAPQPYEVVIELMSGPIAGGDGEGLSELLTFTLAASEEMGPSVVQKVVVTAKPDVGLDAAIDVVDSEGATLGSADSHGHSDLDQTETVTLGAIPLGDYGVLVYAFAGADVDGVPVTITVTYLPVIEGLDGHGGHAH